MKTMECVKYSSKPAVSIFTIDIQQACTSLNAAAASLADARRQRVLHGNRRVHTKASGMSVTQSSSLACSHNACLTALQGFHQAQRPPPWHESHSLERGDSLQCNLLDAWGRVTCRALCSKYQAAIIEGSPQQGSPLQTGGIWPDWWQGLNSMAAACAVAALLMAGGPCSPAEARARLTQVSKFPSVVTPCEHSG